MLEYIVGQHGTIFTKEGSIYQMKDNLGELTRTLLKPGYDPMLICPAPEPHISEDKNAILFIGMNPAGGEDDAERDRTTNGFYLYYYDEYGKMSKNFTEPEQTSKRLMYKKYYKPILEFFDYVTGGKKEKIAWEWCNYNFEDLCDIIRKVNNGVSDDDLKRLERCYDKYNQSNYQIIIRDLVYYHQTTKFKDLLKSSKDADVKQAVKECIDCYIDMFPEHKLKLIYVSTATSCRYIEQALEGDCTSDEFGTIIYRSIPIVFAGRALSGHGVIDNYSKRRLAGTVKAILKNEN